MAKIIEGNLILDDDTVFDESLEVHGSILGKNGKRYNLTVNGNITARDMSTWDISAWNITAGNIDTGNIKAIDIYAWDITTKDISARNIRARNITAEDITAWDITAKNLDAWDIKAKNLDTDLILCEKLVQKPGSTLYAKKVINNRSTYNRSTIDNSQFIKQEESIKQEKCNACGQVLRGKELINYQKN